MENPAKRSKHEVDSIDKDDMDEDECYFDKVPDEVLEKILRYVPVKDNCFLINKRFQKESINATRNRCRLVLDDGNIQEIESILKTGKKFDEVWIYSGNDFTKSSSSHDLLNFKGVIRHFGSSIKTFNITAWRIHQRDFMAILGSMKNVERLNFNITLTVKNAAARTVKLNHLKSLSLNTKQVPIGFLSSLSCPALQELDFKSHDDDSDLSEMLVNFVGRHTQLKQLTCRNPLFKTIQRILEIDGLKLTSLKIDDFQKSLGNTTEATAFISALCKQKNLKALELPFDLPLINGQLPRAISKLPMLENLSVKINEIESLSEEQITDILQMNKLKIFKCTTKKLELLEPLATLQNLQLEELWICLLTDVQYSTTQQREILQAIAKNLRSLKKVEFTNFEFGSALIFASISQSLECLDVSAHTSMPVDTELLTNRNIRKLCLVLRFISMENIKACVNMMPNITTLYLQISNAYDRHDTENLLSIFKLQRLTEFGADADYLEQSEMISTIMEHGKKLKKIIAFTECVWDHFKRDFIAYASQFIIKRDISTCHQIIMMIGA